jgi:hypothetical protein
MLRLLGEPARVLTGMVAEVILGDRFASVSISTF